MVEGNHGTILSFIAKDKQGKLIDLTDTSIKLTLKSKKGIFVKDCTIIDAPIGMCQTILSSDDTDDGSLHYQLVIYYNDGREFACEDIGTLTIKRRLK